MWNKSNAIAKYWKRTRWRYNIQISVDSFTLFGAAQCRNTTKSPNNICQFNFIWFLFRIENCATHFNSLNNQRSILSTNSILQSYGCQNNRIACTKQCRKYIQPWYKIHTIHRSLIFFFPCVCEMMNLRDVLMLLAIAGSFESFETHIHEANTSLRSCRICERVSRHAYKPYKHANMIARLIRNIFIFLFQLHSNKFKCYRFTLDSYYLKKSC